MKKFLKKILGYFLAITLVVTAFLIYYSYTSHQLNKINTTDNIFIWGDSQAKAGFNLELIHSITGKNIYSAAKGGAGVYDFLVFTEMVPEQSNVVLSISQLAQLRDRDKNFGGIPVRSILALYLNHFDDLIPSIRQNLKPHAIYTSQSSLYPYRDTLTMHEPLSKFKEIYLRKKNDYQGKQALFMYGVQRLIQKKCHLLFIEFPFHPMLYEVITQSPYNVPTKKLNYDILKLFPEAGFDTLMLHSEKRMMYDLTHLNTEGASLISKTIFSDPSYTSNAKVHWIVLNGGVCN